MTDERKTYEPDDPENPNNNLVRRGTDGDPVRDPKGTLMIEKESIERIVEGLKIAAEGAAHLAVGARIEADELASLRTDGADQVARQQAARWGALAIRFDKMRRLAVEIAGEEVHRQQETPQVRGGPMPYRLARERFREGLRQASGGMRQIATCFRGQIQWSQMARALDDILRKTTTAAAKPSSLILPPMHERH